MRVKRNSHWLIAACLLFTLLSIGALRAHEGEDSREGPPQGGPPEPPMLSDKFIDKLNERLNLSDGQRSKISAILEQGRPDIRKKLDEIKALHKQMSDQMRDLAERIRGELDSEQKEKFDEMKMRMKGPGMRPMPQGNPREFPPEMWRDPK